MRGDQITSNKTVSYQSQLLCLKVEVEALHFRLVQLTMPSLSKNQEPAEPAEARKIRKAKRCRVGRVGRVGPVGPLIGPFSFPKAWKSAHFSVRQYLARETLELQSVQPSLNTYFSSIRLLLSCCCRFVHHLWRFSTRWIFWGQSIANGSVSERLMNFSRLEG